MAGYRSRAVYRYKARLIPSATCGAMCRFTCELSPGLDRRDAPRASPGGRSPHSLVQEYLNRSEDSLWGFASNGLRLRMLRDNVS